MLFYEYFHGDNGAGLGASHQTGWTGLVAASCRCCSDGDRDRAAWLPRRRRTAAAVAPSTRAAGGGPA